MNLLSMLGGEQAIAKMAVSYMPKLEEALLNYAKSIELQPGEVRTQLTVTTDIEISRVVAILATVNAQNQPLRVLASGELSAIVNQLINANNGE